MTVVCVALLTLCVWWQVEQLVFRAWRGWARDALAYEHKARLSALKHRRLKAYRSKHAGVLLVLHHTELDIELYKSTARRQWSYIPSIMRPFYRETLQKHRTHTFRKKTL